ncbi:unnamed protein product, partial [Ectocarpus sp. 12 AP-2014]
MPRNACMLRLHESMHKIYCNPRKAHARWTGERMKQTSPAPIVNIFRVPPIEQEHLTNSTPNGSVRDLFFTVRNIEVYPGRVYCYNAFIAGLALTQIQHGTQ